MPMQGGIRMPQTERVSGQTTMTETKPANPFRLPFKSLFVARCVERLLGLKPLIRHYDQRPAQFRREGFHATKEDSQVFLRYTQDTLRVGLDWENEPLLDNVPAAGPVVFISNHPLGGLEGVAMTEKLLAKRPDTLVLTNQLLTRIPELSPVFVGVDVLSEAGARNNTRGLRDIFQHLAKGGAVLIYPAGQVSAINTDNWRIEDRQWNNLVGKLVLRYRAHCVPMFVHAKNSWLFYLMSLIHPRLRLAMLARELSNKAGRRFTVSVGNIIVPDELDGLSDAGAVTHYLRMVTDLLGNARPGSVAAPEPIIKAADPAAVPVAVVETDKNKLQASLDALEDNVLLRAWLEYEGGDGQG